MDRLKNLVPGKVGDPGRRYATIGCLSRRFSELLGPVPVAGSAGTFRPLEQRVEAVLAMVEEGGVGESFQTDGSVSGWRWGVRRFVAASYDDITVKIETAAGPRDVIGIPGRDIIAPSVLNDPGHP